MRECHGGVRVNQRPVTPPSGFNATERRYPTAVDEAAFPGGQGWVRLENGLELIELGAGSRAESCPRPDFLIGAELNRLYLGVCAMAANPKCSGSMPSSP